VSGYTTEGLSCLSVESVGQIILTSSGANWLSADRIQLVALMVCESFVMAATKVNTAWLMLASATVNRLFFLS
jgi:hypothetical protein